MATAGIKRMREAIKSAYPGERWEVRVNSMPDYQVVAIYNNFVRSGVFSKLRMQRKPSDENRQFTLADYGIDLGRRYYS